jgi:PAS domain S-box-containing protein
LVLLRDTALKSTWRLPAWVAGASAAMLVVTMAWLRLGVAGRFMLPIGYGVPIVIVAVFRSRRLLWMTAAAFVFLTVFKFFYMLPANVPQGPALNAHYDWGAGFMVLVDMLLVAGVSHLWIANQDATEKQNAELEAGYAELMAREEEIARQNEELQSQTEELERQSEELRVTNEELASREKTLRNLLDLSRALTTDLSRPDTMTRICETLGQLVNGVDAASAILEQEDGRLEVRCHHGFGPAGLASETIPLEHSFGALVLARGRIGYIEDIALRPDLRILQPKEGAPLVSVLAAPLKVGGRATGTLEVYHREKTTWTDQQVALVESLAAQASVSLEAAELFQSVSRERRRFETVLRTVPFGVAVANADCTDIRMNPAGALLFGTAVDTNVVGEIANWKLFQDGRPLSAELFPLMRACGQGSEVVSEELEVLSPSKRRLVVLAHARPIRDTESRMLGAVAAFVDITAQKDLQREIDLRRREAEEASVRKTRFLAAVSHDIRTPANAISLLAELVRRTAANPAHYAEIPELARELHSSALSLVNLLGDVLDIARFDSGRVELQETEFSLGELLAEEHRQMQPLARERGIALHCDALAEHVLLRTDRIKLARILGNLIGNAIKFTDKGGVRVEAQCLDGRGVQIRVVDTGIGIPDESLRHIFDEFFQLRNPERDRNKGSGLGLTICKRLVDAMGGALEVQSTTGVGSTFAVTLPPTCVLR